MRYPFALAALTGLVLLMAALLEGCAAPSAVIAAPKQEANQFSPSTAAEGWWSVRFGLHWPARAEPAWNRDLLLADQFVRPALRQHREAISLWRFHRRAARDAAGHRFSFIFRASPQMQAAWPSFIMGVSQLWLDLIEQIGADSGLPRGLDAATGPLMLR